VVFPAPGSASNIEIVLRSIDRMMCGRNVSIGSDAIRNSGTVQLHDRCSSTELSRVASGGHIRLIRFL
jgi:hypothetical protein